MSLRRLPGSALGLTRRATHLSLVVAGELATTLAPGIRMPHDRIAYEAWATGYFAGPPAAPSDLSA